MKHLLSILLVVLVTHLSAAVVYVDAAATGAGNGTSWAAAFTTLQPALTAAHNGDQVWVAAGTYVPGAVNTAVFTVPLGVAIYGGFIGTETSLAGRAWQVTQTVISSGAVCNQLMQLNGSNTVDGLVFNGAGETTTYTPSAGGALVANPGCETVTVSNCIFSNNAGSGAAITGTDGTWTIDHCAFINNGSHVPGGAPAASVGGAIYGNDVAAISNCIFSNNTATQSGGAILMSAPDVEVYTNDVFINNSAVGSANTGGGAAQFDTTSAFTTESLTFNGCTFVNNTSSAGVGGAIYLQNIPASAISLTVTFENSVLYGNTATAGRGIDVIDVNGATTALNFTTSDVRSGDVGSDSGATIAYNSTFYSDPHLTSLTNLVGADGIFFTADDGAMPLVGSPLIGVTTATAPAQDIVGTTRPANGVAVTLGAYEFVPAANGASSAGSGTAGSGVAGSGSAGGSGTGTASTSSSSGGGCGLGSGMGLLLVGALMFRRKS